MTETKEEQKTKDLEDILKQWEASNESIFDLLILSRTRVLRKKEIDLVKKKWTTSNNEICQVLAVLFTNLQKVCNHAFSSPEAQTQAAEQIQKELEKGAEPDEVIVSKVEALKV